MVQIITSFQTPLWILRRNESDIINCYNFMTPYILRATGGTMLNFGYWNGKTANLGQAQNELCKLVGKFAQLHSAKNVLDVGSGFSAPAIYWKSVYNTLDITCLNVNFLQLKTAAGLVRRSEDSSNIMRSKKTNQALSFINHNNAIEVWLLNGTAKILPLTDECIDRVIALESAQHFKPLIHFIQESRRILKRDNGLLVVAIPVITMTNSSLSSKIHDFMRLGILSLTWASEHHELESVKSLIAKSGFEIINIQYIGSHVYEPLADYYAQNREVVKSTILKERTPTYLQNILYKVIERVVYNSALKMKEASQKGFIDYVLIKAKLL
ncbi:MAG: methyltransferase domain-containing protein [Candidatus Nitrosopolaris sp.]